MVTLLNTKEFDTEGALDLPNNPQGLIVGEKPIVLFDLFKPCQLSEKKLRLHTKYFFHPANTQEINRTFDQNYPQLKKLRLSLRRTNIYFDCRPKKELRPFIGQLYATQEEALIVLANGLSRVEGEALSAHMLAHLLLHLGEQKFIARTELPYYLWREPESNINLIQEEEANKLVISHGIQLLEIIEHLKAPIPFSKLLSSLTQ